MKHNEPDRCPKCGTVNSPDFQFCQNCGCQLPAGCKSAKKLGRNKKTAAIISCVLVVLIFGGFAGYAALRTNQANQNIDLGNKYLLAGDYQQALQAFEKAAEIKPRNARAWLGKADAYISLGKTEEAEKAYKYALELDPTISETKEVAVRVASIRNNMPIAAGVEHSLALREDGTVWAWGSNYNQLAQHDPSEMFTIHPPFQIKGLRDVVAVAAGYRHSLGLREDGTVWAWGRNEGQLGDATKGDYSYTPPVQVKGISDVKAITVAVVTSHSLALKKDGTVWAWGSNYYGQLGDGTTEHRYTPVQVKGLRDVAAITTAINHTLALKKDGTVWAWGNNWSGQLGNGSTEPRYTPVQAKGLRDVVAVAAGNSHSLVLKKDGTVWAWGSNYYGQLGDGTTERRYTPVQVKGLSNVVAIATGSYHTLALREDGTVWAWGWNTIGQLGDGTTERSYTAVQVKGLSNVVAIAASECHNLALREDGTVWAWGRNGSDGTWEVRLAPVLVKFD